MLTIHACGLTCALPELRAGCIRTIGAHEVDRRHPPAVLVLGPAALPRLHPDVARNWLGTGRRSLLLCGDSWPTGALRRWAGLAEGRLVSSSELKARLEGIVLKHDAGLIRWPLAPSDWLPAKDLPAATSDPLVVLALRELADVHPIHDVRTWAAACGVSYGALRKCLLRAFGRRPSDLYLAYDLAQSAAASAAGASQSDTAGMLGYADASGLGHAIDRARRRQAANFAGAEDAAPERKDEGTRGRGDEGRTQADVNWHHLRTGPGHLAPDARNHRMPTTCREVALSPCRASRRSLSAPAMALQVRPASECRRGRRRGRRSP